MHRYIYREKDLDESKTKPIFVHYRKKRRINTRLVRASWKRVFVSSIIYALGLNVCRLFYFELFGKPTFFDEGVKIADVGREAGAPAGTVSR